MTIIFMKPQTHIQLGQEHKLKKALPCPTFFSITFHDYFFSKSTHLVPILIEKN